MTTLIIQIGNTDDRLTQREWADYVSEVDQAIRRIAFVHFFGGSPNWLPWQNVAWVIVNEKRNLLALSSELREIRKKYNQDSIAWTEGNTEFI